MTMKNQVPGLDSAATPSAGTTNSAGVDESVLALADRIDSLVETYAPERVDGTSPALLDGTPSEKGKSRATTGGRDAAEQRSRRQLPDALRSAKVMIVDEGNEALATQQHLEREGYVNVISPATAGQTVDQMRAEKPDLLLLASAVDSALEILRIKSSDPNLVQIPVVLLITTACDSSTKRETLRLGVTDFLSKPVDPDELFPRVRNAITIKQQGDRIADEKSRFEQLLRQRTAEVEASREQLILSLARAAEHRDNETGNHVIRVGCFAGLVAQELGWPDERVEMLVRAAQLHDVGKIGVPDDILFKPGKLEPQEFEMIKRHCAWGKEIIQPFSNHEHQLVKSHARVGEKILHVRHSPMLMLAARIAQTHHENWDGTGYPLGLAGNDIPLEGRITAVADVFDALSSKRPYKEAFPREKCFEILEEMRGKKFDPHVLDAFFSQADRIVEVQLELMDDGDVRWPATR